VAGHTSQLAMIAALRERRRDFRVNWFKSRRRLARRSDHQTSSPHRN
jgi:hypothetical protein